MGGFWIAPYLILKSFDYYFEFNVDFFRQKG